MGNGSDGRASRLRQKPPAHGRCDAGGGRKSQRQAAQTAHREKSEGLRLERVGRPAGGVGGLHRRRRQGSRRCALKSRCARGASHQRHVDAVERGPAHQRDCLRSPCPFSFYAGPVTPPAAGSDRLALESDMSAYKSDFLNVLAERGFIHQVSEPDALDARAKSRRDHRLYRLRLHRGLAACRLAAADHDAATGCSRPATGRSR